MTLSTKYEDVCIIPYMIICIYIYVRFVFAAKSDFKSDVILQVVTQRHCDDNLLVTLGCLWECTFRP